MTALTPLQHGIKLLTEGNLSAAQEVLQGIRSRGEADAASAARFLAHIEKSERRYGKAITTLLAALDDLGPDSATLAQLAELYMTIGKHEDAIAAAEGSLERESDNSITSLNLTIWKSNRSDDPMAIRQGFEAWTERFLQRAVCETALQSPEAARLAPERKLRVGYVSGDLRNHPVRYLIEPYFRLHDHSRFDIHAFMCSDEDEISLLLKDHIPHWHNVKDLDNDAILERIRALGIDILVDLSGHTDASRMSVFAARAAPVQVTWWGFVHTLGLTEIDYRLTDWQTAPDGADKYYTEALCRLQCHTAYLPPVNTEKQYPPPWRANGYVTMISLNHSRKISDTALDTWCAILRTNPESGLTIVTTETSDVGIEEYFLPRLREKGFPMDRVAAVPRLTMLQYMNVAAAADFALDSFPVSGGVTTLHALWMGLPVLALRPPSPITMQTYSGNTLAMVGLDECVASSHDELIERASEWIQNPSRIDTLRDKSRRQLTLSPFMDHAGRVAELESCFEAMWQRFIYDEPVTSLNSQIVANVESR